MTPVVSTGRRALHYCLKIGDRKKAIESFKDVLGMKVLRHEEFNSGCEATCNGPYVGKWSKTMIGYGSEDENFVLELTYNYEVGVYGHGNELGAIDILKKDVARVAAAEGVTSETMDNKKEALVLNIDGYRFNVFEDAEGDKIDRVTLVCTDIKRTTAFYTEELGMQLKGRDLAYGEKQCKLQFVPLDQGARLDRGYAFGRMAFSCPDDELKLIEKSAEKMKWGEKVQVRFITLPTPGKANVNVVILADPDCHEICFVGEEGFGDLSQFDPEAEELLAKALDADKSVAHYEKNGKGKDKRQDEPPFKKQEKPVSQESK